MLMYRSTVWKTDGLWQINHKLDPHKNVFQFKFWPDHRLICRFPRLSGVFCRRRCCCLLIHMCRSRLGQARMEPPSRVHTEQDPDRTMTLVPSATAERSQAATLAVYWSSPANWDRASWPSTVRPPGSLTRVMAWQKTTAARASDSQHMSRKLKHVHRGSSLQGDGLFTKNL